MHTPHEEYYALLAGVSGYFKLMCICFTLLQKMVTVYVREGKKEARTTYSNLFRVIL